jgi:hypothetical protein
METVKHENENQVRYIEVSLFEDLARFRVERKELIHSIQQLSGKVSKLENCMKVMSDEVSRAKVHEEELQASHERELARVHQEMNDQIMKLTGETNEAKTSSSQNAARISSMNADMARQGNYLTTIAADFGRSECPDTQLGSSADHPIPGISILGTKPSGAYFVDFHFLQVPRLTFDLGQKGQIWLRLNYKIATNFFGTSGLSWTAQMVERILPRVKAFGVSSSLTTMNTEYSWYFENPQMGTSKTGDPEAALTTFLMNVLNGRIPTGTTWCLGYADAYLWFAGLFKTFGTWTSMYVGVNWTSYVSVNRKTSFRCGGASPPTGEFIHTSCNGYGSKDHSITSRCDWSDTRVFWFRIESINQFVLLFRPVSPRYALQCRLSSAN